MVMSKRKTILTETTLRRMIRTELLREIFGFFKPKQAAPAAQPAGTTAGQWDPYDIIHSSDIEGKKQLLISMASILGLITAGRGTYVKALDNYAQVQMIDFDDDKFNKLAKDVLVSVDSALGNYDEFGSWGYVADDLIAAGQAGMEILVKPFDGGDEYSDYMFISMPRFIKHGLITCSYSPADVRAEGGTYKGCKITLLGRALKAMQDKFRYHHHDYKS